MAVKIFEEKAKPALRLVGTFVYCAHPKHRQPIRLESATQLPDGRYVCPDCDRESASDDQGTGTRRAPTWAGD